MISSWDSRWMWSAAVADMILNQQYSDWGQEPEASVLQVNTVTDDQWRVFSFVNELQSFPSVHWFCPSALQFTHRADFTSSVSIREATRGMEATRLLFLTPISLSSYPVVSCTSCFLHLSAAHSLLPLNISPYEEPFSTSYFSESVVIRFSLCLSSSQIKAERH